MKEWKAGRTYGVSLDELDLRLKYLHTPSQSAVEGMAASLKKRGQLSPVIASLESGKLVLVDGFKRCAAASLTGLPQLVVMTVGTDSSYTKALTYLMNRGKGFCVIEEALLIRELVEVDGLKQVEVASLLDHHKSWVHRRLDLIRSLAPEIVEDLKLNLLPPGSASSLARLPKQNQADWSGAVRTHRLSSPDVRDLVDLWCKAKDPAHRKYLLEFPKQALHVLKEVCRQDPDRSLRTLITLAAGLQEEWRAHQLERFPALRDLLDEAERVCRTCFDDLRSALEVG
jgi:ParB-like chromosome segregation protein Spo0J